MRIKWTILMLLFMLAAGACDSGVENKTEPDVVFVTTPHKVVREMLKLAGVSESIERYRKGLP